MLEEIALTSTEAIVGGLMGLLGLMSAFVVLGQGALVLRRSRAVRDHRTEPRA